jgi:dTDP-4-dehydrorhamnose 3,5-epimerase-like enzyme
MLIKGDLSVDDRGTVTFVNDFDFKDVKRFYVVENHSKGFVRAWHGHKKEGKYIFVVQGSVIMAYVPLGGFNEDVERVVLSSSNPAILYIPPGHANGFKTLTDDAKVIFYSTSTLEDSMKDDIRFDSRKWSGSNVWEVEER